MVQAVQNAWRYSPGVAPMAWRKRWVKWLALEKPHIQAMSPRGRAPLRNRVCARTSRRDNRY